MISAGFLRGLGLRPNAEKPGVYPCGRWPWRRFAFAILFAAMASGAYAQCPDDADGDGYSTSDCTQVDCTDCDGPELDCDDANEDINPGALETCDDDIDNDCDGDIDGDDEDARLQPDDTIPVYGFESRGVCEGTMTACDLRFPEAAPPGCNCVGDAAHHNFNQVVQACVDNGMITGPCDDGDPDASGSFAVGNDCATGGTCQPVSVPVGHPCIEGTGVCRDLGTVVCTVGQADCDAVPFAAPVSTEADPDPTSPLCFDELDNDCDGLTDHEDPDCQTAELCDGFDNNNNGQIDEGFNLGAECTVGMAGTPCENTGVLVCNASGGTKCSVNPNPKPQITEATCDDGVDNDCDGNTDCDDADCIQPEVCDGVDNDCDNFVDEGFAGLGTSCSVGVGACRVSGEVICNADKTGTRCSANPLPASPERFTAGDSCTDGIDNDCDGLTDDEEAQCGASELTVTCELESICHDCVGWYRINFDVSGASGEPEIDARLLALGESGELLGSLPVQDGDAAKLAALKKARDPDCQRIQSKGRVHHVFAPVPLLRITVRDDLGKAEAYCSNIPYLQVREPDGGVASSSVGDEVKILAAIPNVDPATLNVLIDCVDIIPQLVPDPANQLPGGPFNGTVNINGTMVEVKNLIIDTAVSEQSSNTVSMILVGAGCGGHSLRVEGQPAPESHETPVPPWCHMDDLADSGDWSTFQLTITSPTENQIVSNGDQRPTHVDVLGEVCHGLEIEEVLINGHVATLPPPTITMNGGACGAASKTIKLNIDEDLPITDLAAVFAGTQSTRGSFDPGPNLLVGQATDIAGNTTHDLVNFVVGPAITNPNAAAVATSSNGEIPKAFTLIIDDTVEINGRPAFREFFDHFIQEFSLNLANCLLQPREFCCEKELEMPWWTCNPDVTFCSSPELLQTPEEFADTFNITVTPKDGLVTIRVEIPELRMNASAHGNCCTGGCGFFCVARTKVDFDGHIDIPNIAVEIDIEESDILNQDGTFTLRFIPGDDQNIDIEGNTSSAIKTGCGLLSIGTLIDILTLGISALPRVFFNVGAAFLGFIADQKGIDLCPFVREIGGGDGMQDQSDDASMCHDDLDSDFSASLEHFVDAVEISPQGLAIAIAAKITPTFADGQNAPVAGTMCTEAPLVQPGGPGTENLRSLSMAIADDFWNQLLAGMVQSGKLRASFTKVLDLGAYIPDCEDIKPAAGDPNFAIKQRRYAKCIGTTECTDAADFNAEDDCLACIAEFGSSLRTCGGTAEGQACMLGTPCPGTCEGICNGNAIHDGDPCNNEIDCGVGGDCVETCSGGPTPGAACSLDTQCRLDCQVCENCPSGACNRAARRARDKKINKDTDIVLHARADNPPAFYLVDDPNTEKVEIIFRTGEMRSALIANRDGNNDVGGFSLGDGTCGEGEPCDPNNVCDDGDLDKLDISTVPDCALESLANNVDCVLWSTCLDLDVKFAIGVHNEMVDGKNRPQLDFELIGIVEPPDDGTVEDQGDQCGGGVEIPDLDFLNTEALRNDARKGMERNFCEDTPPFQGCALDFDGTVEFLNPALLTISNCTNPAVCDADFADYLVITGDLHAPGLGLIVADKVCETLIEKTTENKGQCSSNEGGSDEDKEKICE